MLLSRMPPRLVMIVLCTLACFLPLYIARFGLNHECFVAPAAGPGRLGRAARARHARASTGVTFFLFYFLYLTYEVQHLILWRHSVIRTGRRELGTAAAGWELGGLLFSFSLF